MLKRYERERKKRRKLFELNQSDAERADLYLFHIIAFYDADDDDTCIMFVDNV